MQEREAIAHPAQTPSLRTTDDFVRGSDEPRTYRRSTQQSVLLGGRKRTSATGSIGTIPFIILLTAPLQCLAVCLSFTTARYFHSQWKRGVDQACSYNCEYDYLISVCGQDTATASEDALRPDMRRYCGAGVQLPVWVAGGGTRRMQDCCPAPPNELGPKQVEMERSHHPVRAERHVSIPAPLHPHSNAATDSQTVDGFRVLPARWPLHAKKIRLYPMVKAVHRCL